jgi:caffeic acid 3-O-methyltransferase
MDAEEASFMTAQELMMVHIVSMAPKAAMELGLIDALSAAPAGSGALTAAELAAQALPRPAANKAKAEDAVERILRFLTMVIYILVYIYYK